MRRRKKSKPQFMSWIVLAVVAIALAVLVGVYVSSGSSIDHMSQARSHIANGDRPSAVIALKNVLQSDGDNVEARWLLGTTYLDLQQSESALKELERAKRLGKRGNDVDVPIVEAQLLLGRFKEAQTLLAALKPSDDIAALKGETLLGLAQREQAEASLQQVLQNNPDHAKSLRAMARAALIRNHYKEAEKHISRSLSITGDDINAILLSGQIALYMGRFEDALATFESARTIAPRSPAVLIGLVRAHLGLKQLDKADKLLSVLYKASPYHPLVNYLRAVSAQRAGDADAAVTAFREVLRVTPNHAETLLLLGALHHSKNEHTLAEDYLSRYVKQHPERLMGRKLLAEVYTKLAQPKEALETLAAGLESNGDEAKNDAQFLAMLGNAHINTNDYEKGTQWLEQAAQLNPESSGIRSQLALQQLTLGQESEAVETLKSILALDPNFTRADLMLIFAFLKQQQWDEAIATAQGLAERQADNPLPLDLVGTAYRGKGELEMAREYFSRALKLNPQFHRAAINLADMDQEAGDTESAKRRYQSILRTIPAMEPAALRLARLYISEGVFKKAEEALLKVRESNENALRARLVLADGYFLSGRIDEGKQMTEEATAIAPNVPTVKIMQARGYALTGDFNRAKSLLKELVNSYPDNTEFQLRLGQLHMRTADGAAARRNFNKVLKADNDNRMALSGLAQLDIDDGDFDSAIKRATKVSELVPTDPAGHVLLGNINLVAKKNEEALDAYQKAFELAPSGSLVRSMARVDVTMKQPIKAAQRLRQWLEQNPDDRGTRLVLATLDQNDGNKNDAAIGYESILKDSPNNVVALNNLALVYYESGDERALEYAKRAYELAENFPAIMDTYGWLLVRTGTVQQGLALLEKAAKAAPDSAEISYHLAYALTRVGDNKQAKAVLQKVLSSEEEFDLRDDARDLLKTLQ